MPEPRRPVVDGGDLCKVTFATSGHREAEKKRAIAIAEFEKKVASFRETPGTQGGGTRSGDEAQALSSNIRRGGPGPDSRPAA